MGLQPLSRGCELQGGSLYTDDSLELINAAVRVSDRVLKVVKKFLPAAPILLQC